MSKDIVKDIINIHTELSYIYSFIDYIYKCPIPEVLNAVEKAVAHARENLQKSN